jgi:hypothetical protein
MSHYDNNQHDDYGNSMNTKVEQTFDLSMVTDEIPYYDLPAGLMCLLVKVRFYFKVFRICFFFEFRMKIVIIIQLIHQKCIYHQWNQ